MDGPGPEPFDLDVAIVGGCGHVGLPLGLAFADRGLRVALYDIDERGVEVVNSGRMPFREKGADEVLARVRGEGRLEATTDPSLVGRAEAVVVVIGTPVDEHLNPDIQAVADAVGEFIDHLVDGQLLVLRSTVYPGVTAKVEKLLAASGRKVHVAFCPERIAEGKAMTELFELPQIVAGRTPEAMERAEKLFRTLTQETVRLEPEEAELAKLFTNAWRYIKFAAANQLYMIANDYGQDFERIRAALAHDYPRAADMPKAGFAAGPCLFKDTAQLAAFNNNNFHLGQAAMMINEGLPLYVISRVEAEHDLSTMTVGILGMAFKSESDDTRSSLSYKLKRILRFKAKSVLCTDPYVESDPTLVTLEEVLRQADLLIVGVPHRAYLSLDVAVPVIDIWGAVGGSVRV
ncbi:MAG: nucleotide sugar dehydrogenase [Actinomycetota bacterium]